MMSTGGAFSPSWRITDRFGWLCHAYCLMGNHYHLLIEAPRANLSQGMRQLNGAYTQAFNRGHHRVGRLFQGRFKAILVEKEAHLLELCRYVVLNPVRANLVRRLEQWKWSSYRATVGRDPVSPSLTVARYVERNAVRAKLVRRAETWRWSSLGRREQGDPKLSAFLSDWPVDRPRSWVTQVNRAETAGELEELRTSVQRGQPFGTVSWQGRMAKRLGLESTLRPRGQPRGS